jgi:hypothetical protein
MAPDEKHHSAAHPRDLVGPDAAAQALRNGPVGALVVASIAAGLLLVGWLAFYFLLLRPRGAIG